MLFSSIVRSLLKGWASFVFPPLCQICKEGCDTRLFCPRCWEDCALLDPAFRCRHCFEETEEEICSICRRRARIPFASAYVFESTPSALHLCKFLTKDDPQGLAAFALVQWERLDWPIPDAIVPLPYSYEIAQAFALWLRRPCCKVLKSWNNRWEYKGEILEEGMLLLLLCLENSWQDITRAVDAMREAFPKKIFILGLMPLKE